ncbi:hypothetical protein [Reichenbachiella sp.]
MRVLIILILTTIYVTASGQNLIGNYKDYFGHSLKFNEDSTFRIDWRFDLAHTWAVGQWSINNKIVNLEFINVYDTLVRTDKADTLVLSIDEKSNRINDKEFLSSLLVSGGQRNDDLTDRLLRKNNRLLLMDNSGKPMRTRQRGIWRKKKKPTWYFKVD